MRHDRSDELGYRFSTAGNARAQSYRSRNELLVGNPAAAGLPATPPGFHRRGCQPLVEGDRRADRQTPGLGRRPLNRTLVVHGCDHMACRADQLTALSPSTHHSFRTIASSTSSLPTDSETKPASYRVSLQSTRRAHCSHGIVRESLGRIFVTVLTNNFAVKYFLLVRMIVRFSHRRGVGTKCHVVYLIR